MFRDGIYKAKKQINTNIHQLFDARIYKRFLPSHREAAKKVLFLMAVPLRPYPPPLNSSLMADEMFFNKLKVTKKVLVLITSP